MKYTRKDRPTALLPTADYLSDETARLVLFEACWALRDIEAWLDVSPMSIDAGLTFVASAQRSLASARRLLLASGGLNRVRRRNASRKRNGHRRDNAGNKHRR